MEAVIVLLLLFIAAVFVALLVLPVVALYRSREIGRLAARLQHLEEHLRRLLAAGAIQEDVPAPADSVQPPQAITAIPEVMPVEAVPAPPSLPALTASVPSAASIEAWIGRRGLGWVAVVLLLFATAFFLKYAFENDWVGPLGRVSIGLLAGAALCVAGWRYHRQGWRLFSQMLTAAGVVLLYLATFAAFGYYRLVPRDQAAVFLVVLIVEALALAVLYDAPAIALMAVIGGLLNPLLLRTDLDQYRTLFAYLLVLDAGVVGLALFRPWRVVSSVALLGSQGLFWGWYFEHYHPEKLTACLAFQLGVLGLFLAHNVAVHVVRRRDADVEALLRLVLGAFLFAVALYVLLDEDYHAWLGTLAIALATVYTVLTWSVQRYRTGDRRHLFVLLATATAFIAMAFPLQADAAWIALDWAVEGLAFWWFGLRIQAPALRRLGAVFLVLAVGRLVFVDTPWDGREPFVPLFNKYALPALAVTACMLIAAAVARRWLLHGSYEKIVQALVGLTAVLLVWLVLSFETYQSFSARIGRSRLSTDYLLLWARTSPSVFWAVYAALVLAVGFRLHSHTLRWAALALFGLTLGKVILVDMGRLPGFYRVAAFFVLALMMAAAAWGYQKLQPVLAARASEGRHETT